MTVHGARRTAHGKKERVRGAKGPRVQGEMKMAADAQ
jgi:hypothetical protein